MFSFVRSGGNNTSRTWQELQISEKKSLDRGSVVESLVSLLLPNSDQSQRGWYIYGTVVASCEPCSCTCLRTQETTKKTKNNCLRVSFVVCINVGPGLLSYHGCDVVDGWT